MDRINQNTRFTEEQNQILIASGYNRYWSEGKSLVELTNNSLVNKDDADWIRKIEDKYGWYDLKSISNSEVAINLIKYVDNFIDGQTKREEGVHLLSLNNKLLKYNLNAIVGSAADYLELIMNFFTASNGQFIFPENYFLRTSTYYSYTYGNRKLLTAIAIGRSAQNPNQISLEAVSVSQRRNNLHLLPLITSQ